MHFFLFPGQGSQTPGMGKDFHDASPAARAVFDEAAALRGPDFLHSIFDGTAEELAQTQLTQVALLTVEAAVGRHLETMGCFATGCAGHSLGEITALVYAGTLEFGRAFRLVEARARLMSENVPPGGMAAVLGLDAAAIEAALPPGVDIANYNGPQQTIISGSNAGLAEAERRLKAAGAKRLVRLPVSGPFHSSYMRAAAENFREELAGIEFRTPRVPFVSSVNAEEVSSPDEIRELLARQLCSPVRWTEVMKRIGPVPALEVGPGRVLQGIAKRMEGAPRIEPAGTLEDIKNLEAGP